MGFDIRAANFGNDCGVKSEPTPSHLSWFDLNIDTDLYSVKPKYSLYQKYFQKKTLQISIFLTIEGVTYRSNTTKRNKK